MDHKKELELIVELAITKTDLEMTKKMGEVTSKIDEVRTEIQTLPPIMDAKIKAYDKEQVKRRRWTLRTIFGLIAITISAVGVMVANWPS